MATVKKYKPIFVLVIAVLFFSCKKESKTLNDINLPYQFRIPEPIPFPDIPEDNPLTIEKVALGKKLFFDPILSKDSTIACATCHKPSLGFADFTSTSKGVFDSVGFRNAIGLTNVAYSNIFFWDGGVPTLELQAIAPIVSPFEMQETIENVLVKLNKHKEFSGGFQKVFGRKADQRALIQAIASFERTLISFNSRFDKEKYFGQSALTDEERKGRDLFFSNKTNCFSCHSLPNFTNQGFANNGLYDDYEDLGRRRVTVRFSDDAIFKIPTLRNIERSAPYMHDGSLKTLEEVVEHYNSGGSNHFNKSELIRPLQLNEQEKKQLVAFLKALTDEEFLNNPEFQ